MPYDKDEYETCGLVGKNIKPYTGVQLDITAEFKTPTGPRHFRIITYQAYDAYGLIGTEINGVAVLDDDQKQIVCDKMWPNRQGGWGGATQEQVENAERLADLRWDLFKSEVSTHEQCRPDIF